MKKQYIFLIAACLFITGLQNVFAQTPTSPMEDLQMRTFSINRFHCAFEQYEYYDGFGSIHNMFVASNGTSFDTLNSSAYKYANSIAQLPAGAHLSAASGDWDGDGHCDNVTFAFNKNGKPYLQWTKGSQSSINSAYADGIEIGALASTLSYSTQSRLNVASGRIDADDPDEIVLAYVDSSTKAIHINVYGKDGSGNMYYHYGAVVPGVALTSDYDAMHLATGDLDNDGDDEIVIGYIKGTDFSLAIYKQDAGNLTLVAQKVVYTGTAGLLGINGCSVACGRFTGTNKKDVAWATSNTYSNFSASRVGVAKIDMAQSGTNIITAQGTPVIYGGDKSNLACGDLNGDFTDEIIYVPGTGINVIRVTNNGSSYSNILTNAAASIQMPYANSGLVVADVNNDLKAEIMLMGSHESGSQELMEWRLLKADAGITALTIIGSKYTSWNNTNPGGGGFPPIASNYPLRRYCISAGPFDGLHYNIGQGVMYMKPSVVQPLIILNAPPIHFDILEDEAYDVAQCFNGGGCTFKSSYFSSNVAQTDVSTELTSDWGLSGTLAFGGSFGVIDVGGYMTAAYGEQYSKVNATSHVVDIQLEAGATVDDKIYASVSDLYVWEYPVYRRNAFIGYIANATPVYKYDQWFDSKTWTAFNYIPNHEVGNILSYKNYLNFGSNPDVEEKIKATTGSGIILGPDNQIAWSLNYSDVVTNSASAQKDIGIEVGANAGVGGVSLETSASYNKSDLKTYSTTLSTNLSLGTSFGTSLDMSIGEVAYKVTPYTYWANNGALVLDYAVDPEVPISGGTVSWWTANYSVQDPAFIMPWRYDPEKGYTLQDNRKRRQSKSITFFPAEASIGDTVSITTAVDNYSLVATDDSIKVQFFIGDPLNGNMITDVNGVSDFYVPAIAARDRYTLHIDWQVPTGIYKFPRIYAVIDPDNTLTEIHRNNDVGFNIFSVGDGELVDTDTLEYNTPTGITQVPANTKLMHTYPNPFSSNIQFEYNILQQGAVQLNIYDLQGRLVATPINTTQSYGMYATKYDASALSKGVYSYRFTSGNHTETGKLIKF